MHQQLECFVVEMASTVGRCINLLECCITAIEKWHQQLECASIVGMETENGINIGKVHQMLELAEIYINSWYVASTCWDGN